MDAETNRKIYLEHMAKELSRMQPVSIGLTLDIIRQEATEEERRKFCSDVARGLELKSDKLVKTARIFDQYLKNFKLGKIGHEQNVALLETAVLDQGMREFGELLWRECFNADKKEKAAEYRPLYGGHGDPWGWQGPSTNPLENHIYGLRNFVSKEKIEKYIREDLGLSEISKEYFHAFPSWL